MTANKKGSNLYKRDSMSMTWDHYIRIIWIGFVLSSESLEFLCISLAAVSIAPKGQGMWRDRYKRKSFIYCILFKYNDIIITNFFSKEEYEKRYWAYIHMLWYLRKKKIVRPKNCVENREDFNVATAAGCFLFT